MTGVALPKLMYYTKLRRWNTGGTQGELVWKFPAVRVLNERHSPTISENMVNIADVDA